VKADLERYLGKGLGPTLFTHTLHASTRDGGVGMCTDNHLSVQICSVVEDLPATLSHSDAEDQSDSIDESGNQRHVFSS